jgi:hypothetical protein
LPGISKIEVDREVMETVLEAHALLLKFPSLVVSYISERVQAAARSTIVEDLTSGHGLTPKEVDTALNLAKNVFKCESLDSERVAPQEH